MSYEVRPVGSKYGEDEEVVKIDSSLNEFILLSDKYLNFAIVISMTCQSHQSKVKNKLIVPNVTDYQDAYKKAREKFKLNGEWATNVGVTLFEANKIIKVPKDWKECEVQFES
ncbi:hypothetical protein ACH6EH_07255 [Paenibacillus sp. JSM ZJ436]|uniref:hypothetical protein n=1 Tax=Paenibacillus sp. JSM ZJ436 TaxID=3376190 RepID=UPI00379E5119